MEYGQSYSDGKGLRSKPLVRILQATDELLEQMVPLCITTAKGCVLLRDDVPAEVLKRLGLRYKGGYLCKYICSTASNVHALVQTARLEALPGIGTQSAHLCGDRKCLVHGVPMAPRDNLRMKMCRWVVAPCGSMFLCCFCHVYRCFPPFDKIAVLSNTNDPHVISEEHRQENLVLSTNSTLALRAGMSFPTPWPVPAKAGFKLGGVHRCLLCFTPFLSTVRANSHMAAHSRGEYREDLCDDEQCCPVVREGLEDSNI